MHSAQVDTQRGDCNDGLVLLCHGTIVPGDCVKFSAPAWFTAIANCSGSSAGGEDFRLKDLVIMKIKMLI